MPDYKAMRAEGRSIGKRRGKAMAQIEENRRKQERKQQMEQRFRELADNKAAQQNEIAKSQYAQAQAEQANENQLVAASVTNGTMMEDGTYLPKHWNELAIESLGGNVKDLTQEQIDAESARIAGGAQKGYTRKYSSNVAAQNLQKQLEYNEAVRERDGSRQFHGDGVDGAIGRLGQKAGDALFGKEEELVAPTMQGQPQGNQFGFNEEYTGSVPDAKKTYASPKFLGSVMGAEGKMLPNVIMYPDGTPAHPEWSGVPLQKTIDPNTGDVSHKPVLVADYKEFQEKSGSKIKIDLDSFKNAVPSEVKARFKDSKKVLKLATRLDNLTTIETSSMLSKGTTWAETLLGVEWEFLKGNDEDKTTYIQGVEKAEITAWEKSQGEDLDLVTAKDIRAALGGMKQDSRALAYALVRLQRDSGRFNGQELKEQLELLSADDIAAKKQALQRAVVQAKEGIQDSKQEMVEYDLFAHLAANGVAKTVGGIRGNIKTKSTDKDGYTFYVHRNGDYAYSVIDPTGGINHVLKKD